MRDRERRVQIAQFRPHRVELRARAAALAAAAMCARVVERVIARSESVAQRIDLRARALEQQLEMCLNTDKLGCGCSWR